MPWAGGLSEIATDAGSTPCAGHGCDAVVVVVIFGEV